MATLHKEYAMQSISFLDRPGIDKDIYNYIETNTNDIYDEILMKDDRWEVFFHLSEMRKSILNWYDFSENSSLLEIGAGFGALTGLFCDKCNHVTSTEKFLLRAEAIAKRYQSRNNLDVYVGAIDDIKFEKQFDYISVIGSFEYQGKGRNDKKSYINYLKRLKTLLKPNGKILLSMENRFGIKYFCGEEDPFTGVPFMGINNYPVGAKAYTLSLHDIKEILSGAEIGNYKIYYPVPDSKMPQLIFTDDYMPTSSLKERVIPYYINKNSLVAYENDLYDDLVINGVFPFFSNSFLIECSKTEEFCHAISVSVSTDRGPENSFATVIYDNKTVEKRSLYKLGEKSLERIYTNMMDLEKHGISVVPHFLGQGYLRMPYIEYPTLSDHLRDIICKSKMEFLSLFDKLYSLILMSSEHIDDKMNFLRFKYPEQKEWGPILRKAYIDMIPINCFYSDGNLIFFDQEFVRENFPANYIMYRAIFYTYYFFPHANTFVSVEFLKSRYKLNEVWNKYEQEENRFVAENRRHNLNRSFLDRATIDRNVIFNNMNFLKWDPRGVEKNEGL